MDYWITIKGSRLFTNEMHPVLFNNDPFNFYQDWYQWVPTLVL